MPESRYTREARRLDGMTVDELRNLLAAWEAMGLPGDAQPVVRVTWAGKIKSVTVKHDPEETRRG